MSDCERFAQNAQDKWATVSELLRLLRRNERPWANRSGRSRQMSYHERFAQVAQRIAHFLFFGEGCEWITQVAHQKWAMWGNHSGCLPKMSDHERSWVYRSGHSPKMSKWVNHNFFERIARLLIFGQKTSNSLRKPMSKFPALYLRHILILICGIFILLFVAYSYSYLWHIHTLICRAGNSLIGFPSVSLVFCPKMSK